MKLPLIKFYNCRYTNSYEAFPLDKRILLFGLKGAYIDSSILKNIDKHYTVLKSTYDDIYVIAMNDSYVIDNWANDLDIKNITVLPDGNGHFTEALGALTYTHLLGFRSKYYECVVHNNNILKCNENTNLLKNELYSL